LAGEKKIQKKKSTLSIVSQGKRRNKKISKKLFFYSWSKIFFTDGRAVKKYAPRYYFTTRAHEQHARRREREREREVLLFPNER